MDTKNILSSRTVQGLLVLVLVRVLSHFGVALPDATINDIVGLAVTVGAALYSAYGYVAASGRQPTALTLLGLLIQYAPKAQMQTADIAENIKWPRPDSPAAESSPPPRITPRPVADTDTTADKPGTN